MNHLTPAIPTSQLQPTLADVLAAQDGKDLSALRRRDLASAVRRVARMAGQEPYQVPFDMKVLSAVLERGPANGKVPSPKTVQNLRSDLFAAIDMSGLKPVSKSTRVPLSPEWQALHDMVPGERIRIGLSSFMRDCSARGIAPECVTDATVADFCSAVASGSLKTERQIRRLARDIPRLWNEARIACPAWPQQAIAIPDRRSRSRFKQNLALPGILSADEDEWLGWCAVPDPLDANARHRRLAPRTIALRREQVLAAVTAALDEGIPADRLTCLSGLVEIDVFKAILTRLHRNAGGKPNAQTQAVSLTLVSLAQEWAKVPPEHLQELKRLRARLPALPKGLVPKNRALLRRFEDPVLVHRLLELPAVLWREAVSQERFTRKSMVKAQLAIALAIQLTMPLRPRNLYALSFEHEIKDVARHHRVPLAASRVRSPHGHHRERHSVGGDRPQSQIDRPGLGFWKARFETQLLDDGLDNLRLPMSASDADCQFCRKTNQAKLHREAALATPDRRLRWATVSTKSNGHLCQEF